MTATPAYAARELTLMTRWCPRCAGPATALGAHRADGSFDPYSVPVSDSEIEAAADRSWYSINRKKIRANIALGKHVGSYE